MQEHPRSVCIIFFTLVCGLHNPLHQAQAWLGLSWDNGWCPMWVSRPKIRATIKPLVLSNIVTIHDNERHVFLSHSHISLFCIVAQDHAMSPSKDWARGSRKICHQHQGSAVLRVSLEAIHLGLQGGNRLKLHALQLVLKQLRQNLHAGRIDGPLDFRNSETGQAQLHVDHQRDLLPLERRELSRCRSFNFPQEILQGS